MAFLCQKSRVTEFWVLSRGPHICSYEIWMIFYHDLEWMFNRSTLFFYGNLLTSASTLLICGDLLTSSSDISLLLFVSHKWLKRWYLVVKDAISDPFSMEFFLQNLCNPRTNNHGMRSIWFLHRGDESGFFTGYQRRRESRIRILVMVKLKLKQRKNCFWSSCYLLKNQIN